jgi:hypothetical protein
MECCQEEAFTQMLSGGAELVVRKKRQRERGVEGFPPLLARHVLGRE